LGGAAGQGGGGASNVPGQANTGGGGGSGAGGGSGVVVVSYAGSPLFTGGTVTQVGGSTIHTFTTSASLAPLA
jgi:hypothetical protein